VRTAQPSPGLPPARNGPHRCLVHDVSSSKFFNLDKIADKVKGVVMSLQSKIEQILDKVIGFIVDKAKALWEALKSRGKKPDDGKDGDQKDGHKQDAHAWWRVKQPFHAASGGQHTLFFHGQGPTAKLYMASEPRSLEDVLKDKDLSIEDRSTLEAGLGAIKTKIDSNPDIGKKSDQEQNAFQASINEMVQKLAQQFASRLQHEGELPASVVTFGASARRASFALGMPLTKNPGNTKGAEASGRLNTEGDRFVDNFIVKTSHERTDKAGNRINVQMNPLDQVHLVHSELHGPFSAQNIVLGDKSINRQMQGAEQDAIRTIKADGQIRYRVNVAYHADAPPPDDISEIPDPVDQTVQSWVGFYVAREITVTSTKMSGTDYTVALTGASATGSLPPVHGQIVETIEDMCVRVARANLDPSAPNLVENGVVYLATKFNLLRLQAALNRNENQMRVASERLRNNGIFRITVGRGSLIYVRQ
jgi:hypothetical protein